MSHEMISGVNAVAIEGTATGLGSAFAVRFRLYRWNEKKAVNKAIAGFKERI